MESKKKKHSIWTNRSRANSIASNHAQALQRPEGASALPRFPTPELPPKTHTYIAGMIEETDRDFTNHSIRGAAERICHRQEVREQKRSIRRFESLD